MIIGYTGLAGSGKTYSMTQTALKLIKKGEIVFSRHEIEGAYPLVDERELLRMQHCHVFFDEWHQDHSAKEWYFLDEVVKHIVTQSRKYSILIHWSAQHWLYMDAFIRRNTDYVWEHEALFRDPNTGASRFGLHYARKITGLQAELKYRRPDILAKRYFFIKKKVYNAYDSFKPIMLSKAKISDEELEAIADPYQRERIHIDPDNRDKRESFLRRDEAPPDDAFEAIQYENNLQKEIEERQARVDEQAYGDDPPINVADVPSPAPNAGSSADLATSESDH